MLLLLFLACAGEVPAWAVNHASVVPDATGLSGTQTWEFFRKGWKGGHSEDDFLCARAQSWVGSLIASPEGCRGCLAAYQIEIEEIETDCPEPHATDPAYGAAVTIGIGKAPSEHADVNPYGSHSLGWYASYETGEVDVFGFAWEEALDYGEQAGDPGWHVGTIYTLWPVVAWDLGG